MSRTLIQASLIVSLNRESYTEDKMILLIHWLSVLTWTFWFFMRWIALQIMCLFTSKKFSLFFLLDCRTPFISPPLVTMETSMCIDVIIGYLWLLISPDAWPACTCYHAWLHNIFNMVAILIIVIHVLMYKWQLKPL